MLFRCSDEPVGGDMNQSMRFWVAAPVALLMVTGLAVARPIAPMQHTVEVPEVDAVGDRDGAAGSPAKALQDTAWIADWSFDANGTCVSAGWTVLDNRVRNHGENYWTVDNRFNGVACVTGKAAVLSKHDLCWGRDGYGNDWDYAVICKYSGAGATLTFCKLSDSEPGFDFVIVEADSLGLSEARANLCTNPRAGASSFRTVLATSDGLDAGSTVGPLALPNYGAGTHEVYIRFTSDGGSSDEDGDYPTVNNAFAVWLPAGYDGRGEWPGLLFLHGSGECGRDGEAPARVGLGPALAAHPERWPFVVVFPQKPTADTEWEEHEALVFAVWRQAQRDYHVDSKRVALTGMSQGGHGAWMIAARAPQKWKALATVCGYGRAATIAPRVATLPVWAFHGLRDDVVDPADTRKIVTALRAERTRLGLDPEGARMTLYADANHNSWDAAYGGPELPAWLTRFTAR